jgi:hypothetical protein
MRACKKYLPSRSNGSVNKNPGSSGSRLRQKVKETRKAAEELHPENAEPNYISKTDAPLTAFKHAQMVEMIAFFLQAGDDPELYTWVGHRLRTILNWAAGNTVFPRPIHLAEAFIRDINIFFDTNRVLC